MSNGSVSRLQVEYRSERSDSEKDTVVTTRRFKHLKRTARSFLQVNLHHKR
jgi:hypothetical protein